MRKHGYGYLKEIVVRRANNDLYIFKEGDFPCLRISDLEDMLLFVVQNRLINLSGDDVYDFTIALRMFTKSLVIQKRVKDLQLGSDTKVIHNDDGNPSRANIKQALGRSSRIRRLLQPNTGTLEFGLQLYASLRSSLVAYSDNDGAGCHATRRSTYGYYVYMGNNPLSWSSKRQHIISRSSAEAEYRDIANVVAEMAWLQNLLRELHTPLLTATLVYCDNYADIFAKGLPSALFEEFHASLSLWDALERLMRGSEYGEQDRKAAILYEYETFKAIEGEQLLDT
ncbi:ribonuclease H-like domain-containing protein [Tanacetum coccineum]